MKALILLAATALSLAATAAAADDHDASGACRRYIPSAGMTIPVACPTVPTKTAPAAPTPPAVVTPAPTPLLNEAPKPKTTVSFEQPKPTPREAVPSHRDPKLCGEILERAQLGQTRDDDVKTLRRVCRG